MKYFTFLFLVVNTTTLFGQNTPNIKSSASLFSNEKIKIALLGTMHFTPSSQDKYSNDELKLTVQKQKELEAVILKLVAFNPDQICVEVPMERQTKIDQQYQDYLKGNYTLELNEIDLIGFQTAKRIKSKGVTCINYLGSFKTKPVQEAAEKYNQEAVLQKMNDYAEEFVQEMNDNEKKFTMMEDLVYLNNQNTLNKNLALYTKYYAAIGKDANYEGVDLVSEWYTTNLHIYANIIRQIKPADKTILVVFGVGHIPILKHLFESNSDFEVVEIDTVLK